MRKILISLPAISLFAIASAAFSAHQAQAAVSLFATSSMDYTYIHATSSQSTTLTISSNRPLIIAIGRTLNDGGAAKPNFQCEQDGVRYNLLGYAGDGMYQMISARYLAPTASGTANITCWTTNHTGLSGQVYLISLSGTDQTVTDFATSTLTGSGTIYTTDSLSQQAGDFLLSAIQSDISNFNQIEATSSQIVLTSSHDCDSSSAACTIGYTIAENSGSYGFSWYRQLGFGGHMNTVLLRVPATVANAKTPVIIVPGILGSRLNRVSDGEEVWPDISQMLRPGSDSYLDDLRLSTGGVQIAGKEMVSSDIIRQESVSLLTRDYYKDLIDSFIQQGYVEGQNLFVAPYDWRLGVENSNVLGSLPSTALTALSVSPTGKIDIIAHSMGGLVVKEYLAQNPGVAAQVDKLILAGIPQLGAPRSFKLLERGDDLNLKWFGFGLNSDEAKNISQNMPSVYELLPSRKYVEQGPGNYVFDERNQNNASLSFYQTNQFLTSDPADSRNPNLLSAADVFHLTRDGALVNASIVYNLVGCQNSATIGSFILQDDGVVDVTRANGDGTVPVLSATNLSSAYNNYYLLNSENGIDHLGLVSNPKSISLIQSIIQNTTPSLDLANLGISTSPTDCFQGRTQPHNETTIEISTHSPVALNAYDSQNRHTGPNDAGNIDLQIPGSSYETIGENSFILLPASDTYHIVGQGLSAGSFTLKRKSFDDGSRLLGETTYVQVPLASSATVATLLVSSLTPASAIALDSDGNGTTDATIQPTAILSASLSADITPPTITMPNIASSTIVGTPITFSYSAIDDLSGVATTTATLDGSAIDSGTTLSNLAIGLHAFRAKAIDNAGNPRVNTIIFNVVYGFSGFLSPIKQDDSGLYKLGRTLPVKFQLTDVDGQFLGTALAQLFVAKFQDSLVGTDEIALSTGNTDAGNNFRYDETSHQYIFNLDTNTLSTGTWQFKVALNDGTSHTVLISLH